MLLRIFSDKRYIPEGAGHVVMLYPFWGKNEEDPRDPSAGRFDRYMEMGKHFFHLSSLEEADLVVFPSDWGNVIKYADFLKKAEEFIERANQFGKPVVIFFWSDSDQSIEYKNTFVFRTSLYRSRRRSWEFAQPAWSEDIITKYFSGKLPLRRKSKKPVIGFCGYPGPGYNFVDKKITSRFKFYVKSSAKKILDTLIRSSFPKESSEQLQEVKNNPSVRAKALMILEKSKLIKTNFIIRSEFLAGSLLPSGKLDYSKFQIARKEFIKNILDSDYILAARGGGNFSYRFYETLCCGRIPIFIDTDCVLPYHSDIEWKNFCIWIDEKDIQYIDEKVADFHSSVSDKQFLEIQMECRKIWEKYLSPEGFFYNFYKHFYRE